MGGHECRAYALAIRAERRFTCVTQLMRQRRSVTGGGITALRRSAAGIRW
jgi:hypothetical protein